MKSQKVKILLRLCGDYVSFNEISTSVLYDLTNDVIIDEYGSYNDLEDIKADMGERNYCDIQEVDAVKIGNEYYYKF